MSIFDRELAAAQHGSCRAGTKHRPGRHLSKAVVDDTFVAGLLHDVGKLVLVSHHPDKYSRFLEVLGEGKVSESEAERQAFGATHAEVSGYLLWLWGLADVVVEAVTFHHDPSSCPHSVFGALTAVHLADALLDATTPGTPSSEAPLDTDYLARIGVLDQLPAWWDLKAKKAGQEPWR